MTQVKIFPGPCGFEAVVKAVAREKYSVQMTVETQCPAVRAMAEKLPTLELNDIVGKQGFGRNRAFTVAADCLAHAACPVLSAYLKAAEVEMGLAVPRTVTFEFEKTGSQ